MTARGFSVIGSVIAQLSSLPGQAGFSSGT